MTIEDTRMYGLTGAQVKKIVGEIRDAENIVTAADYDWPESSPDGVALWKREGVVHVPAGVKVYFCNWGSFIDAAGSEESHRSSILVLPTADNTVNRQIYILLPQGTSYVSDGNTKQVPGRLVVTRHSDGELLQDNFLLGSAQLATAASYADSLVKGSYAIPNMGAITNLFKNLDTPIINNVMNWDSVVGSVGMMKLDVRTNDNPPTARIMVCVKVDDTDPDNVIYTWIQAN